MKAIDTARRRALKTLSAISGAGWARVTWAHNPGVAITLSDTGKQATRLADEVYVIAQDLSLLQEFYAPRDTGREKRAQQGMATAMSRLEGLAKESRFKAQAGKLGSAIAKFVDDESAAARSVIATQASLHVYRTEEAKYPLGNGPHLGLLNYLFGKLPGIPGTPEFYLQLLTWARKGFPPIQQKLNMIDPALTPREVYLRKLQQLVNPGNPGFAADKGAINLKDKFLLDSQKELSKANALKGEK